MIVDCHTHWGVVWERRDRGDPSRWLAVLDRHGVGRAFLMVHAGILRQDLCASDNETVARLASRAPERLVPIGTAWPQMGAAALEEVRRCVQGLGMRGLKFHPWLQGFSTADRVFAQICALAGELRVPVFFHDGTPCYSLVEQVAGLARRFPACTFVLGHSGLLWNWRSVLAAARLPNLWVCLCGPHMRALETICRRASPERLLWGSDFGFGFADPIAYRLALLRAARIEPRLRDKILTKNPLRLLSGRPANGQGGPTKDRTTELGER